MWSIWCRDDRALLDDGRVVLERQFRYPAACRDGRVSCGEDLMPANHRWLAPNANCRKKQAIPRVSGSKQACCIRLLLIPLNIDIWFARGLTLGEQQLDSEFLEVFSATPDE
jgi:ADP-ribose pyrophosphatase